jgi:hypothetical protein
MLFSYQTGYIMWHSRLRVYIPWYITDLTIVFWRRSVLAETSLGLKQHLNHLYCIRGQMLYYSVLYNNYRYKYILLFLNYYCGDNYSEFNSYIKGFRNNHLPFCFSCFLYRFEQRIPTGQSTMDNPEKLAA